MHLILLKFVLCSIKSRARYVWSMRSQFDSARRDWLVSAAAGERWWR